VSTTTLQCRPSHHPLAIYLSIYPSVQSKPKLSKLSLTGGAVDPIWKAVAGQNWPTVGRTTLWLGKNCSGAIITATIVWAKCKCTNLHTCRLSSCDLIQLAIRLTICIAFAIAICTYIPQLWAVLIWQSAAETRIRFFLLHLQSKARPYIQISSPKQHCNCWQGRDQEYG